MLSAARKKEMHSAKISDSISMLDKAINEAWQTVSPYRPIKNFIATNPLLGFQTLPFEGAVEKAQSFCHLHGLPSKMEDVNRQTIKWCQAYFDKQQAVLSMPFREDGLYFAWRALLRYDKQLHKNDKAKLKWIRKLPSDAKEAIRHCLYELNISPAQYCLFMTLLLSTLSGWSGYIQYLGEWSNDTAQFEIKTDYLAMRLVIMVLLDGEAASLLAWYQHEKNNSDDINPILQDIKQAEASYRYQLSQQLNKQLTAPKSLFPKLPHAQFIFCIDVRSEPVRRRIEAVGHYETLGFAGFFGVPITVLDEKRGESHAACPVLVKPTYTVHIKNKLSLIRKIKTTLNNLYRSLKYNAVTPFMLAEIMGVISGLGMILQTFITPLQCLSAIKNTINRPNRKTTYLLGEMPIEVQAKYAESALKMMGLTKNFAPIVVICGHGGKSMNNAYQSALDCGACGGYAGGINAEVLAGILNSNEVRRCLLKRNIQIDSMTIFLAAQHNTTTDEIIFSPTEKFVPTLSLIKDDLEKVRQQNSQMRMNQLRNTNWSKLNIRQALGRACDWAETRPEWGLANNAAFIAAPRWLTREIDLQGRCFLHSYDWQQDEQSALLESILTAPLIVAQWINCQYLFSTLDNIHYGSGSKITQNLSGKIGMMQGNGSDLMHGLPLQSVFKTDLINYHEPMRLLAVVYAPRQSVTEVIHNNPILQQLFANGWILLTCIDPIDNTFYHLSEQLNWQLISYAGSF